MDPGIPQIISKAKDEQGEIFFRALARAKKTVELSSRIGAAATEGIVKEERQTYQNLLRWGMINEVQAQSLNSVIDLCDEIDLLSRREHEDVEHHCSS